MMGSWSLEDVSILVVEEDDLLRDALHDFVAATFARCLVLKAGTDNCATIVAESRSPDVIIVDIPPLRDATPKIISRLRSAAPDARIVALTREDIDPYCETARLVGPTTCLPMWSIREKLQHVLEEQLAPNDGKTPKTIVCVEDDAEMVDLIKLILRRHSFDIVGVLGGRVAWETISQVKPDLVLLDLMMPEVSGWDVYEQMKADEETKDVPVIVVTVMDPNWSRKRGLAPSDVEGYLVKPFLPRALVSAIKKALDQDPARQ